MLVRIGLTLISLLCELSLLMVDGILTPLLFTAGLAVSTYHWISHSPSMSVIVNRITGCDLPDSTLLPEPEPVRHSNDNKAEVPHPLMFLNRQFTQHSAR